MTIPVTAVPPITWTIEGVVLPTDAEILEGVQSDIDTAFGGGVNPGLSTPQGQLASSEAAVIAEKNSRNRLHRQPGGPAVRARPLSGRHRRAFTS